MGRNESLGKKVKNDSDVRDLGDLVNGDTIWQVRRKCKTVGLEGESTSILTKLLHNLVESR
jgi:hypothetical protein